MEGCRFLDQKLSINQCESFEVLKVSGDRLEVVELYLERDRVQFDGDGRGGPEAAGLSYARSFENVRDSFMGSKVDLWRLGS